MAGEPRSVLFYTKAGCPLCEEARHMLGRLERRYPMIVTEVDITSNEALFQRYRDTIPVVVVDGRFTLGGRIDEAELVQWLEGGVFQNSQAQAPC